MEYSEGDDWRCGFCGEPTWKFHQGEWVHEPYQAVMAWHAYEAHQVNMGDIDQARAVRKDLGLTGWAGVAVPEVMSDR